MWYIGGLHINDVEWRIFVFGVVIDVLVNGFVGSHIRIDLEHV